MSTSSRDPATAAGPADEPTSRLRRFMARVRQRPVLWCGVSLVIVAGAALAGHYGLGAYHLRTHRQEASRLLADSDFEGARTQLEDILRTRANDAEAHFLLARVHRRSDNIPLARRHLDEARRLNWSASDIEFETRLRNMQVSGPGPADGDFLTKHAAERSPQDGLVLEAMYKGMMDNSDFGRAVNCLNEWVERHPEDWLAHYARAKYYTRMGNYIVAEPDLLRVLELRPGHDEARRGLIDIHLKNKNPLKALPLIEQYLADYPERVDMLVPLARCLRASSQGPAARKAVERLLEVSPGQPSALLILAQLEADEGHPEAARRCLRELEKLPLADNEEIHTAANLRITVCRRLGLDDEAVTAERRLLQLNQDLANWNELRDKLRERPATLEERFQLGTLALRMGIEQQGLYWFDGVLRDAPGERKRVQTVLLEYYETRADPKARARVDELRRELGRVER